MSNKSREPKRIPPSQPPGGFRQVLAGLSQAAQQAKERAEQAKLTEETAEGPNTNLQTSKPDTQEIGDSAIKWTWNCNFFIIEAIYVRSKSSIWEKPAGTYFVMPVFTQTPHEECPDLTKEQTLDLAQALLSAYQWADVWQNHMGEFLMVENTPLLEVVEDKSDDDDDESPFDTGE